MCLLVASPVGKEIPISTCERATRGNRDGFGVAYPSDNFDQVIINKWHWLSPEIQHQVINRLSRKGIPFLAHWRAATSGGVCRRLAHPFEISRTCALAHNGIFAIRHKLGESDTSTLVDWLKEEGSIDLDSTSELLQKLPDSFMSWNRIAIIGASGMIKFCNEKLGAWKDDLWYSCGEP